MRDKKIKIALLGLGLDNQALLVLLDKQRAPIEITVCDFRSKDKLPKIKTKNLKLSYRLGADFNRNLHDFSLLFRSPGWPISCPGIQAALKTGKSELTSSLNLFFQLAPTKNIIGVTGTKGKGTTATLIYQIIKRHLQEKAATKKRRLPALTSRKDISEKKVFLGGNIGVSPLSFLQKIKKNDFVVLELSSFQLEDLNISPRIAVITNIFKEHLAPADPNNPNFHTSEKKYWQAKLNIARGNTNRYLVANKSLQTKLEPESLPGQLIYFGASPLPSRLVGKYNQENIGAAVTVSQILKIKPLVYEKVISRFTNLEHRLELVNVMNGISYYDNSFSTTPESTALDLASFSEPLIQIAGGADKGANFGPLAKLIKTKVKTLILLPGTGSDRLEASIKKINFPAKHLLKATNMRLAVLQAKKLAKPGDVVLLSTACASFGIFKNYKERGDLFKKYARQK